MYQRCQCWHEMSLALIILARPKSQTLGSKLSSNRMLLDFMSRWMIWGTKPSCRNESPRAEPRQIFMQSGHPSASMASAQFLSHISRLPFSITHISGTIHHVPIVSILDRNSRSPWNWWPPCQEVLLCRQYQSHQPSSPIMCTLLKFSMAFRISSVVTLSEYSNVTRLILNGSRNFFPVGCLEA